MGHIEYRETQVIKNPKAIIYEDGHLSFKGDLVKQNLYDLNSSEEIYQKVVTPALNISGTLTRAALIGYGY